MHEGDHIVKQLRKLATECDSVLLELPRNPVGLPDGSFILDHFLEYIADCLVGKVNPTANESKVESTEPNAHGTFVLKDKKTNGDTR